MRDLQIYRHKNGRYYAYDAELGVALAWGDTIKDCKIKVERKGHNVAVSRLIGIKDYYSEQI
jgi:hypothetical protein